MVATCWGGHVLVIRRAEKSVPATKRSMGPNVGAAGVPVKYIPGTPDSNAPDRRSP